MTVALSELAAFITCTLYRQDYRVCADGAIGQGISTVVVEVQTNESRFFILTVELFVEGLGALV